jgi:Holliday junction resolvase RusA-like endonuclease
MSKTQSFTIPGQPIPQGRPRFTTRAGYGRAYDDPKSRAYKNYVAVSVRSQGAELIEGPCEVEIVFFMKRPKSLPKKVRHHVKRPDIDNLVKGILDALNGELWKDDSQVCKLTASKVYTKDMPCVWLTAEEAMG